MPGGAGPVLHGEVRQREVRGDERLLVPKRSRLLHDVLSGAGVLVDGGAGEFDGGSGHTGRLFRVMGRRFCFSADEEREFLMSTEPLYDQWEMQVKNQGRMEGRMEGRAEGQRVMLL